MDDRVEVRHIDGDYSIAAYDDSTDCLPPTKTFLSNTASVFSAMLNKSARLHATKLGLRQRVVSK